MRVATYNIRTMRAVDRSSLWWLRRGRLATVIEGLGADLIGLQEAYPAQIAWLGRRALRAPEWASVGVGRNAGGGGEAVPLWHRRAILGERSSSTRWFGPTPGQPGSKLAGAQFPRIATFAEYEIVGRPGHIDVVNVHLDSSSAAHRATSIGQIVEWLAAGRSDRPTIVMGDFNATMDEPGFAPLGDAGLVSVLPPDAGPTSNGFGRRPESQHQIDHIFVSEHFRVEGGAVVTDAGHASDHYPVVVDLALVDDG